MLERYDAHPSKRRTPLFFEKVLSADDGVRSQAGL
jgi:hypothetical protein